MMEKKKNEIKVQGEQMENEEKQKNEIKVQGEQMENEEKQKNEIKVQGEQMENEEKKKNEIKVQGEQMENEEKKKNEIKPNPRALKAGTKPQTAQTEQSVEQKLKKDIVETHYSRINRPIEHTLVACTNCDYVPFGECSFYKDDSLQTSLTATLHLFVSKNNRDFQMFPKLSKGLIQFAHGVFHHVVDVAMEVITPPQMIDYAYLFEELMQILFTFETRDDRLRYSATNELLPFIFLRNDLYYYYILLLYILNKLYFFIQFYLTIVHTLEEGVQVEDRDKIRDAFTMQITNDIPKDFIAKARAVFQTNFNDIIMDYKKLLS
ncbi:MAG: hypothetical protein EZS28_001089 [Streblomastix strix]|uniref:Uncharacterized protein n=1 Tax=Streblomastix strix TaxID=222440 RepID=A0A5J4XA19_9EUKA|nr:MAG: hypothetical protein EZS28_001089 [Streblomastix strix]